VRKRKEQPNPVAVVELDDIDRRALSRRHPELIGRGTVLVVAAPEDLRQPLVTLLQELVTAGRIGRYRRMERLVEMLSPKLDVPPPKLVDHARNEAVFRQRVMRDFGALRPADLAEKTGSTAANKSQLAYRWRRGNKIFAVPHSGASWFLSFQFGEDGHPLPVVADVLEALQGWDPWAIAHWFVTANGLLQDRPPVEFLDSDPDAVRQAAARDGSDPKLATAT